MKKRKFKIRHLFILLFFCYVGYTLASQQMMINRVKGELNKYSDQSKKIEESNEYLNDQIDYAKTEEYTEKVAREKIGLVKSGEIVYVLKDGQ